MGVYQGRGVLVLVLVGDHVLLNNNNKNNDISLVGTSYVYFISTPRQPLYQGGYMLQH